MPLKFEDSDKFEDKMFDPDIVPKIRETSKQIQDIYEKEDDELITIQLKLATLNQKYWDLKALAASDQNEQMSCARIATSYDEQVIRCTKTIQVDLLRDLWNKAEAMEKHSSALKELE